MKRARESVNTNLDPQGGALRDSDVADGLGPQSSGSQRGEKMAELRRRIAAGSYRVRSSDIAGKLMGAMSKQAPDQRPQEESRVDRERS